MIYAIKCKEEGDTGSAKTRFMGRGTRTGLPNSWERFVDWRSQIERNKERKEKGENSLEIILHRRRDSPPPRH